MAESSPPPTDGGPAAGPVGRGIDWAAVLAQNDRWLRTAVLARLGERQAVDEVMQEVAVAALAQRARLKEPAKAGAWLYGIAVRIVRLHRRRCGRQKRLADGYARTRGEAETGGASADPLGWLVLAERRQLVRAVVARLPPRDAEILLLKYTEGWSYRELAAHLGVDEGIVQARLHRARGRFREAMARSPLSEGTES